MKTWKTWKTLTKNTSDMIAASFFLNFLYFPGKRWAANFVFRPRAAIPPPSCCSCWFPVNKPAPLIAAPTMNLSLPCLKNRTKLKINQCNNLQNIPLKMFYLLLIFHISLS